MIKHVSRYNIPTICEHFSEKDGVPISYVCTSALGDEAMAMDIFYRDTPHPEFGNRYFGIYMRDGNTMITNADVIEHQVFSMIEDSAGQYHYSQHRHDCVEAGDKMIDGGRAYVRGSGPTKKFVVHHGEFVEAVEGSDYNILVEEE